MSDPHAPTNRLALETSPYLLLHASNPVDWYPWGNEAFERARREDKPIFLSVGYSTCYWCHVMERESFSNSAIAEQINRGFVAIKLDREERPDLDEIYMLATQLLTEQGGWPNSVFLTPDREPFFAGTYFPPSDRHGRPGFPRVLEALSSAWRERRGDVEEQARSLAEAMRHHLAGAGSEQRPPRADLGRTTEEHLGQRFDPEWGGFGSAPKFPSPSNLWFLLDRARGGSAPAGQMLTTTLDRMARGGLYDQLAGGFHRYSTDARWLVPHFEKMLYDNAALLPLYAEAAVLFEREDFKHVAQATLAFVQRELTGSHGGFLSALDAETDGHEGLYYTWPAAELERVLDAQTHALLAPIYGFDGAPNFEDARCVLHLPEPLAEQARRAGLSVAALRESLEPGRRRLMAVRDARPRPLLDDKVLTDWNGLMIGGAARLGRVLGLPHAVQLAERAATFVLEQLGGPPLQHAWRGDRAHIPAMLDDYAFLVEGLLELAAASDNPRWLSAARALQEQQDARLWDATQGGYFQSEAGDLLVRAKSATDGAIASGNGVAAMNLLRLHQLTGEPGYALQAERLFSAFATAMERHTLAHVTLVRGQDALAAASARGVSSLRSEALAAVRARARWEPAGARVLVELEVAPGFHLNGPSAPTGLVPTRISGDAVSAVEYPATTRIELVPGQGQDAYVGCVEFGVVTLDRAPGSLWLEYQACDSARCLPSLRRELPIEAN